MGRLAELAGITVRTLHHYDEIGLVRPSARTRAGYRAYAPGDVERLRQVLMYRRLGFGLREVAELVADPARTRPPTCGGSAGCCCRGETRRTPWWRPSTRNWRHGRWAST